MENHSNSTIEVKPVNKSKVKLFLRVTLILFLITMFEFLIAFTISHEYKYMRVVIFVVLTIFKAYYIISEFMHLGHERKSLKLTVLLPFMFILFLMYILIRVIH